VHCGTVPSLHVIVHAGAASASHSLIALLAGAAKNEVKSTTLGCLAAGLGVCSLLLSDYDKCSAKETSH